MKEESREPMGSLTSSSESRAAYSAKGVDVIELGEENIDGERDAERLGKLAEALIEHLSQCANLLGGIGRQDALDADADDDGASGKAAVGGEDRAEPCGDGGFDEPGPEPGLAQQRAAGFGTM
jgi:hypothetical protein